jgi:bla regulator protein BlaR1
VIDSGVVGLANHLWQSTLFAVVVGCLTFLLRRNAARVRYLLWLVGSVKFLVPFALLTAVGARIPWPVGQLQATHIASTAGQMATRFTTFGAAGTTALVTRAGSGEIIRILLGVLWIIGAIAILVRAFVHWVLVRRALHDSAQTSQAFVIPVRSSASLLEPAVVGILRPVLLLPKDLDQRLAPEEIRAVLAHERCHVVWKDNLAATLHMLVEALFWFHPLIWWLGARLVNERERACDEYVLAEGHSPASYAEGILKVCEHYLESHLPCVAGVSGANLRLRIELIMKNPMIEKLGHARKLLITVMASATIIAPMAVGVLTSPHARAQTGTTDREEPIVSIHICCEDGTGTRAVVSSPDRQNLQIRAPLRSLIAGAYNVSELQVVGRDWSKDPMYQISVDAPQSYLRPGTTVIRDLLVKHFGLVVRVERELVKGYVLRISTGGMKLTPSTMPSILGGVGRALPYEGLTQVDGVIMYLQARGLRAPVVDQTGLGGNYDNKVSWLLPQSLAPGEPSDPAVVAKRLDETLGLRLEAKSVNVDVVNVVSVKPPEEVVTAGSYTINLKDADVAQVAAAVHMATGRNFVIDPRVHAQLTMYSSTPMSSAEFYQAFLKILRENHFLAVSTGDLIKIIPEPEAQ